MSGRWRIVLTPLVILFCAACLCYALRPTPHVLRVGIFVGSPWGVPGGDIYGLFDESIAAFEEAHPGVEVTYVSGISRDDYGEWLAERFLAGDEPDVFLLLPEDFELYAAQGALLPLTPLEKDDAAFDASAFYPAAFAYGQYDGESMALPLACMTRLMFVNKTLLAREGIAASRPPSRATRMAMARSTSLAFTIMIGSSRPRRRVHSSSATTAVPRISPRPKSSRPCASV